MTVRMRRFSPFARDPEKRIPDCRTGSRKSIGGRQVVAPLLPSSKQVDTVPLSATRRKRLEPAGSFTCSRGKAVQHLI
jgi:hypothetical protein